MNKLVFATNNTHKLCELRRMLAGQYEVLGLADIGCHDDIPETAQSFEGNALLKAQWVAQKYGYDCIADDSGLEVEALNGAPGIYSARFAGEAHNDNANNELLLTRLSGATNRRARFRTALVLLRKADGKHLFEGTVEGEILTEPHGTAGFGYDPLFRPQGWSKTFAEATPDEKNATSHRGRAVAKLCEFLANEKA